MILYGLLCGLVLTAAPASAQETGWVEKLDAAYYYPERHGLKNWTARIEWSRLDTAASGGSYLNNPELIFQWRKGVGGKFSLGSASSDLDRDLKRELLAHADLYGEILMPRSLKEKFAAHTGRQLPSGKNRVHLEFESTDPERKVRKYQLIVDRKKRRIQKLRMLNRQDPRDVVSRLRYTQKEGLWLVAESLSRFDVDGHEYQEVFELRYGQVQGIWLPRKITHTFKKDDVLVDSSVFLLKNHRVSTTPFQ